jgi:hypothetical protein
MSDISRRTLRSSKPARALHDHFQQAKKPHERYSAAHPSIIETGASPARSLSAGEETP